MRMILSFIRGWLLGITSAFTFPSAPLYRYPYFFPREAMRGDWMRIGGDIQNAFSWEEDETSS